MRFRALAVSGSLVALAMELGQFAGPRNEARPPALPVEVLDRTDRPIVVVPTHELWVEAYFVPTDKDSERPVRGIVYRLKEAKTSIRVQAYGFTSREISDALIAARGRGVDVKIILDRSEVTDPHTMAWACQGAGIPVLFDHAHAIAHNKVIVIDGKFTFTGSYNFTDSAATRNAENCVMISSPKIAEQFLENWEEHASSPHSTPAMPGPLP